MNAAITRDVLDGRPGGPRDAVLMNAAAALYVAGNALSLSEGVELARVSIDSGRAMEVLERMIAVTNRLAHEAWRPRCRESAPRRAAERRERPLLSGRDRPGRTPPA